MDTASTLPMRVQHRVKRALQYLEYNQYSKGLKIIEELLSQHPQTPTLLSIRSLFLFYTEGYVDSVPIGELAVDLEPENVGNWARLGRQHLERWEYAPALRCFRHIQALEPQNRVQEQTFCRLLLQNGTHLEGAEVAFRLWRGDKSRLETWIYLILELYLTGKWAQLGQIIDKLVSERGKELDKYQVSELISAKLRLYLNYHRISEANLAFSAESHLITDPYLRLSYSLRIQIADSHLSEARETCRALIALNPEQIEPIRQLLSLSPAPERELKELLEKYPKSETLILHRIEQAAEQELPQLLAAYLYTKIHLKTPAVSIILKRLLHSHILREVVAKLLISLENSQSSDPRDIVAWGFYTCSCFFFLVNDLISAQHCIDQASELLPEEADFLLLRSKLLYRSKNLPEAINLREKARKTDPRDRYLNYKCAVYHLLGNDINTANDVIAPFSVDAESPGLQLHTNQEIRYELKLAEAWERLGRATEAMQHFLEAEEHFRDISSVLYRLEEDFLLRFTVNTYVDALEACGNVFGHKLYVRVAKGILRTAPEMRELDRNQVVAVAELAKRTIRVEDSELQKLLFAYLIRENRVFLCLKIALKASEPEKTAYLQAIRTVQSPHFRLVFKCVTLKS